MHLYIILNKPAEMIYALEQYQNLHRIYKLPKEEEADSVIDNQVCALRLG